MEEIHEKTNNIYKNIKNNTDFYQLTEESLDDEKLKKIEKCNR